MIRAGRMESGASRTAQAVRDRKQQVDGNQTIVTSRRASGVRKPATPLDCDVVRALLGGPRESRHRIDPWRSSARLIRTMRAISRTEECRLPVQMDAKAPARSRVMELFSLHSDQLERKRDGVQSVRDAARHASKRRRSSAPGPPGCCTSPGCCAPPTRVSPSTQNQAQSIVVSERIAQIVAQSTAWFDHRYQGRRRKIGHIVAGRLSGMGQRRSDGPLGSTVSDLALDRTP